MSKFALSLLLILSVMIALPVTAQQANTAGLASLVISGIGAAPAPGPFTISIPPGNFTWSFAFSGAPLTPWALLSADPLTGGTCAPSAGGAFPPVGILDLSIGPWLTVPIDGIAAAPGSVLRAFASTSTTGLSTYPVTLPMVCGALPTANLQGLMLTTAPGGYRLTAAFSLASLPTAPDGAPVPIAGLGDDTSTLYSFAACSTMPFYGAARPSYDVNSNGNITFGAFNTDFTATQAEFNTGPPRIAPIWNDWTPAAGTVTKFDTGAAVTVAWAGVPEFGLPAPVYSFAVSMVPGSGLVTLTFPAGPWAMTYPDGAASVGITGITPGTPGGVPTTVFGPGPNPNGRISAHLNALYPLPGAQWFGAAMESLNEVFDSPAVLGGPGVFDLGGLMVNFSPLGPVGTSYVMY